MRNASSMSLNLLAGGCVESGVPPRSHPLDKYQLIIRSTICGALDVCREEVPQDGQNPRCLQEKATT
jgi:hypothetical protein